MNKYLRLRFQITAKVTEEVNFLACGTPHALQVFISYLHVRNVPPTPANYTLIKEQMSELT
jgi:hypothetical protein